MSRPTETREMATYTINDPLTQGNFLDDGGTKSVDMHHGGQAIMVRRHHISVVLMGLEMTNPSCTWRNGNLMFVRVEVLCDKQKCEGDS